MRIRVGLRPLSPYRMVEVEHGQLAGMAGQQALQMSLGEQDDRLGVFQHEAQPLGRIGRVEGHISASGLEHRQQGHDHLEAALHADGHPGIGPHPQFPEVMRQLVGPPVQLRIAQLRILEDHRGCIRAPEHLLLEQLLHALVRGELRRGVVPLVKHTMTLGPGQDLEFAHRRGRSRLQRSGQRLERGAHELADAHGPDRGRRLRVE